ncbi:MAG: hypothetical protein QM703_29310 [Gemmatales bacterium]
MLPFLFGSLSKWLTSKSLPREIRRHEAKQKRLDRKSIRKDIKLSCETLENRITPTVKLFNTSSTLVGTFTGSSAIQDAVNAAAASYRLDVDNDEAYGDFVVSGGYNGLVIRRDPAASGAPVVDGNSGGSTADINSNITISGLRLTNSSSSNTNGILLRSGAVGSTITLNRVEGYSNANGSGLRILAGAANLTITQNTFDSNTLGVFFVTGSGANNAQLLNNFFTNNTSDGVRFQAGFTGTGTALHNNQFSGNGTYSLDNASAATIDASSNWWNSTNAATIAGTINGVSNVDFTPFLNSGDYDLGTAGFQPDLSYLHVTALGVQVGATGRIQEAVNDLQDGSLTGANRIINVLAGTYADNVQVNKSVSILGPNAAINPNTGSRVAEAIVVPAVVETSLQSSTSGTIFRVGNGSGHVDVTIKGLTIDGHNAALSGGRTLNGVEIDTGAGIINSIGSFDSNPGGYDAKMIVQNNIIQNLERYGVLADGIVGGTPLGGTDVSFNKIDNLPSGNNFGGGRGRAAAFEENHYGTFSFNVVTRANVGWQDDNYYLPAPGGIGTVVTGNTISSYHRGIFHNLQYATATDASITNNTLNTETTGDFPASSTNFGLELASIQSGVGATVTNNNASGHVYGILIWNVPTTATITVSGGTLTNNQYGVYVTNYDPQFGDGSASSIILSGLTINNSIAPGNTGIFVNDDAASAHGAMTATITGSTTISNGTTGLVLSGANARLGGNTLNNTSFTGQSGQYVTLANGAYGSPFGYIDGTSATYGGVLGSGATVAQGFTIENKITHGTDTAGLGYVRITPNLVYVTQASGSIQRGVNVASANDTLYNSAGTFAGNVSVNKTLTIRGAQFGVNANTRFAAFTGGPSNPKANPAVETILTASYNDPNSGNPGANDLLRTIANNITVDGLVIDGNNAAIAGSSPVQFGGVDIDARRGITTVDSSGNYVVTSGLKIQNNIIQNVSERGVNLDNDGTAPAVKHLVTGNVIRSFGDTGVILFWNAYTDVTNNTIDARLNSIGLSSQNFFAGGMAMTWSGNTITVGQDGIGIHVNLFYDNGAALTISGNTINAGTGVTAETEVIGADDLTWGINLWSFDNAVTVNVTNNTIGSSGGQFARGVNLWNITAPAAVTVSGGTISSCGVGINMDATDPYYAGGDGIANISNVAITGGEVGIRVRSRQLPYSPLGGGSNVNPAGNVRLNISGGSITGATTGILVEDSYADGYTASAQMLGGTTISGATTGISVTGAETALVGNTLANTIFTGVTGNYVTLASGCLARRLPSLTAPLPVTMVSWAVLLLWLRALLLRTRYSTALTRLVWAMSASHRIGFM